MRVPPGTEARRINSRRKGKNGELEVAHFLTERGFPARRTQQFNGLGKGDVVADGMEQFHIEVKFTQKAGSVIYEYVDQAIRDKQESEIPLVVHRRNNKDWLAILLLEDFVRLVARLRELEPLECLVGATDERKD